MALKRYNDLEEQNQKNKNKTSDKITEMKMEKKECEREGEEMW